MADDRSLVLQRQRKLKWPALDWLESLLMVLCGAALIGFCTPVVCDIVTRTIGAPRLWLPEGTSTLLYYGIFIGGGWPHRATTIPSWRRAAAPSTSRHR